VISRNRAPLDSRFTPLNGVNAGCERTCAELLIYSGDLHPTTVTERLGIQPTHTVVKGEESQRNSLGRTRMGKLNAWFLSSEDAVESKDIRHHLDWLLGVLLPNCEALLKLQQEPQTTMYVFCPWWSNCGGGVATQWPEQMSGLAQLNLECSFAFADYNKQD
jgi:hypothetical protein